MEEQSGDQEVIGFVPILVCLELVYSFVLHLVLFPLRRVVRGVFCACVAGGGLGEQSKGRAFESVEGLMWLTLVS